MNERAVHQHKKTISVLLNGTEITNRKVDY